MIRFRSFIFVASALLVAACTDRSAPVVENATTAETSPVAAPAVEASPAADGVFDLAAVPLSSAALGEFPYIALPDGYVTTIVRTQDFASYPFWTGQVFQTVEGRRWMARIGAEAGKSFSALELQRNIDAVITGAGGVKVADGQIPRPIGLTLSDDIRSDVGTGLNDYLVTPTTTWVIRQADRTLWIGLNISAATAGLTVVQAGPFVATANLLPADQLLQSIQRNGKVAIQVNFAIDRADILPDSTGQIDEIAALLTRQPALRLSIDGHTDNTGSPARNQTLSEARARSVVAALTGKGVAADRLRAQGLGQTRPLADNATEDGRARNRRVELVRL